MPTTPERIEQLRRMWNRAGPQERKQIEAVMLATGVRFAPGGLPPGRDPGVAIPKSLPPGWSPEMEKQYKEYRRGGSAGPPGQSSLWAKEFEQRTITELRARAK